MRRASPNLGAHHVIEYSSEMFFVWEYLIGSHNRSLRETVRTMRWYLTSAWWGKAAPPDSTMGSNCQLTAKVSLPNSTDPSRHMVDHALWLSLELEAVSSPIVLAN